MVERYLIKKSLMKPIQAYNELKRLKSIDFKTEDAISAAQIKDLKYSFAGFE